jgi:AraC-like DNA-binding protein
VTHVWGIPDRPVECRLLHVGRTRIGPEWAYLLRSHYWRLYINDRAGAAVAHPGGTLDLDPASLYLLPAWGDFRGSCRGQVGHLYVHFLPRGLVGDWAHDWVRRPITVPCDAVLGGLSERLQTAPPGPAMHLVAAALVAATLAAALDRLPPDLATLLTTHLNAPSPVDPAIDRIRQWPGEDLSVAALARRCGLGPDRFTRLFKRRTGRPPRSYVQESRVSRAAEALLGGNDSIEMIATANGFANRYHFTRVFARIMGRAPAAYRRDGRR